MSRDAPSRTGSAPDAGAGTGTTTPDEERDDVIAAAPRPIQVLAGVERVISVALLVALLALVVFQVVSRYVFATPFPWTEELARYAMVWLTFVAAGLVMARARHLTVVAFAARLSPRPTLVLETFSSLIVVVVSAVLVAAGIRYSAFMMQVAVPATDIPMGVVYAASVVGFALITVHGVVNLVVALRTRRAVSSDESLRDVT